MSNSRAALVVRGTLDLEVGHAVVVESLGAQPEPAMAEAPACTAQGDASVRTGGLLEVSPGPSGIGHMIRLILLLRWKRGTDERRSVLRPTKSARGADRLEPPLRIHVGDG